MIQSNLHGGGFLALRYPSRYPLAFKVFSSEPLTTLVILQNGLLGIRTCTYLIQIYFFCPCCCDYTFQMSCMVETVKAKESWALVTSEKSVLGLKHAKSVTVLSSVTDGTGFLMSLYVMFVLMLLSAKSCSMHHFFIQELACLLLLWLLPACPSSFSDPSLCCCLEQNFRAEQSPSCHRRTRPSKTYTYV